MIAGGPIAGHPIAALLLRRGGTPDIAVPRGSGGYSDIALGIMREDEEILAVIMAFTQRGRFPRIKE